MTVIQTLIEPTLVRAPEKEAGLPTKLKEILRRRKRKEFELEVWCRG